MDTIKPFICGFFAGIFESIVEYPFDVMKTHIQTKGYNGIFDCANNLYYNEGIKGFYYGYSARVCSCVISGSVLFGTNEYFKKILGARKRGLTKEFLGAAGLTGCVETLLYCPIDLVKSRMQIKIDGNLNFRNNTLSIYKKSGFKGFYKGIWVPTLWKEGIGNMFYFGTYEVASNYLKKNGCNKWIASMLSGGLAGTAYWVVFPIDTIKTMKQTDNKLAPRHINSFTSMINIYNNYGIKRLYRGITSVIIRAWPANMALFLGYEMMKNILCV